MKGSVVLAILFASTLVFANDVTCSSSSGNVSYTFDDEGGMGERGGPPGRWVVGEKSYGRGYFSFVEGSEISVDSKVEAHGRLKIFAVQIKSETRSVVLSYEDSHLICSEEDFL